MSVCHTKGSGYLLEQLCSYVSPSGVQLGVPSKGRGMKQRLMPSYPQNLFLLGFRPFYLRMIKNAQKKTRNVWKTY